MKRYLTILTAIVLCSFTLASASAESFDFSNYSLESMIEMRTQLNSAIAEATVKQNSTLTPVALFDGDILFRNLPWGASADVVLEKLVADGMADRNTDIENDTYIYAWKIAEDMYIQSNAGANISIYDFPTNFTVAGYPLSAAQIYCPFGYSKNSVDRSIKGTQLMLAEMTFDVADIDLVYADLTNKLTSLYGTPEEVVDNNSYTILSGDRNDYTQYNSWMVWSGTNNTGVFLYKTYRVEKGSTLQESPELTLVYGKTNGKAYLDGLTQAISEEKKAQDALTQQQNANSVDGL